MALNEKLALIGLGLIALSIVPQIVSMLRREIKADPISPYLLLLAGLVLLGTIFVRSYEAGFPMVANTYEVLVFFSASLCVALAVLRLVSKRTSQALLYSVFGATIMAAVLMMLSSSPLVPKAVTPPIPALRSFWMVLHVGTAIFGEAFFGVSFVASILYLLSKDEGRKAEFDRIMYKSVMIGFPIFTAGGLIFASIWAEYAWGSYWSWDPKETWSLITWLVYAALLHSRIIMRKKGKTSAIISVIGFSFTIFTFAGVNFILSGLHSYAK